MHTVFSPLHARQNASAEFFRGVRMPSFEVPERARIVHARIEAAFPDTVRPPDDFGLAPILRVHDAAMVDFLRGFWPRWQAESDAPEAFPSVWPPPRSRPDRARRIGAELGRYCIDLSTPVTEGSWDAAYASAQVALTAQSIAQGPEGRAFALCRPPGHHAGRDYFGGYCFLNNAAIAAQAFRDAGVERVAVLDIDYHHGNGTQDVFYDRGDVLFVSIHADPALEYPYYAGHADESGLGVGEGATLNIPLAAESDYGGYATALEGARRRIADFRPGALVVSLGVDTFIGDPMGTFRLAHADFEDIGSRLAGLRLPTLFVMEGGYAVDRLGDNVAGVLLGFEAARQWSAA